MRALLLQQRGAVTMQRNRQLRILKLRHLQMISKRHHLLPGTGQEPGYSFLADLHLRVQRIHGSVRHDAVMVADESLAGDF